MSPVIETAGGEVDRLPHLDLAHPTRWHQGRPLEFAGWDSGTNENEDRCGGSVSAAQERSEDALSPCVSRGVKGADRRSRVD